MENKLEIGGNLIIGIESGSNSNGSYVKFSDGTLICYGQTAPIDSGTLSPVNSMYYGTVACNHSFPMAFIDVPFMTNTIHSSNIVACNGMRTTASKINWIGIMSPQTSVISVYIEYIAIGRWK